MTELFNITHDDSTLDEYDATVTDGGDLSAGAPGLAGTTAKMEALVDGTGGIYGQKDFTSPASNKVRFRFYIDPNGLEMGVDEGFDLCDIFDGTGGRVLTRLIFAGGNYRIYAGVVDDAWAVNYTSEYTITDDEHYVEVYVQGLPGTGSLELFIDGVSQETISNLDNDTRFGGFDNIRMGAIEGLDVGTLGTFYLDELKANDDGSEIGEVISRRAWDGGKMRKGVG